MRKRRSVKVSPAPDPKDPSKACESFAYVGENSKMHFEMRSQGSSRDQMLLEGLRLGVVIVLGLVLALIGSATIVIGGLLRTLREDTVEAALSCHAEEGTRHCQVSNTTRTALAYMVHIGFGLTLVLLAAALTAWAPAATGSGLPELKAFLNGCHMPKILQPSTLVAKAIGTMLVVTSGLPIGREGPMVHIGAALAVCLSSIRYPGTTGRLLFEMRSPSAQRNWVGVGAAAGVAAAFNAPLGGILYSFEEVCSHWSPRMTWLSFLCSVTVVATIDVLTASSGGFVTSDSLVNGLDMRQGIRAFFVNGNALWIVLLGAVGGVVGAAYNLLAFRLSRTRKRILKAGWIKNRHKSVRVAEAAVVSILIFSLYFWVPYLTPCSECPSYDTPGCGSDIPTAANISDKSGGSASGSGSDSLHHRLHSLRFRRWACPPGQYSELATMLHAGQEELIKHLLSRDATSNTFPTPETIAVFLPLYFVLAVLALGLAVPAGNFIPALTIGAALGRLEASLLHRAGVLPTEQVGHYALVGGAAALGGVTRMTMTIAVILAEVSDDVATLPACMLALAVARFVGGLLSPSFDHGMIELLRVPFLRETPPTIFEVLTAKDVMAPRPVRLLEVTTVRDIVHTLQGSGHNGFPVVSGSCLSLSKVDSRGAFFVGLILRRQLLVLLKERIWESQLYGQPLSNDSKDQFLTSFYVMAHADLQAETTLVLGQLPAHELDTPVDLRSFFDPAPLAVSNLTPLTVVYRLFNEIGVRHIPVLTAEQSLLGIITRKDVQPETISRRLTATEVHTWATEMHDYWRGLLFGSAIAQCADYHTTASARSSLQAQAASRGGPAGRRMSSAMTTCRGSSTSETVERRRSLAPALLRFSVQKLSSPSSPSNMRESLESPGGSSPIPRDESPGGSDAFSNSSNASTSIPRRPPCLAEITAISNRSSDTVGTPDAKNDAGAGTFLPQHGVELPAHLRQSVSRSPTAMRVIDATTGSNSNRDELRLSLRHSLLYTSPTLDAIARAAPSGYIPHSSRLPSLSASLRRAALRESQEVRAQAIPQSLSSTRSRSPADARAAYISPSGDLRASRNMWQFSSMKRRGSAPARMLSFHFESLNTVCESSGH